MTDIFHAVGAGDPALVDELLRADRRLAHAHTDDGVSVVLWAMYVGQPRLAVLCELLRVSDQQCFDLIRRQARPQWD